MMGLHRVPACGRAGACALMNHSPATGMSCGLLASTVGVTRVHPQLRSVTNVPPHRVSEGDVIVVAEGQRVVADFHVESTDPVV